jgi:hypothetical protein
LAVRLVIAVKVPRLLLSTGFLLGVALVPARAEPPKQADQPDPNAKVTLTLAEIQAIVAAQVAPVQARVAECAAQPALLRLQDQIKPK